MLLKRLTRAMKMPERGAISLPEILVGLAILVVISVWVLPNLLGQRTKGVDGGIRSDINAMSIAQETFLTDNPRLKGLEYNGTAWVGAPAGYTPPVFRATAGNDIRVQIAVAPAAPTAERGYCIRGSNPDASAERDGTGGYFWYDSVLGGLQTASTKPGAGSACSHTTL